MELEPNAAAPIQSTGLNFVPSGSSQVEHAAVNNQGGTYDRTDFIVANCLLTK